MRYSLVIYNNFNDLQVTDITGFSKRNGFEDLKEDVLEDIVKFTNSFQDKEELKEYLKYSGLIGLQINDNYQIGIAFYRGKKSIPSILPYGISYKKDKRYFNVEFLKSYFYNRIDSIDFMQYFISRYYDRLRNVSPFMVSLNYINDAYNQYLRTRYLPNEIGEEIKDFVKSYTLKKDKVGNYLINFTRVRELAMFAINYERTRNRENNKNAVIVNNNDDINREIAHYEELLNDGVSLEEAEIYKDHIRSLKERIK